jgi:hypothetical protein
MNDYIEKSVKFRMGKWYNKEYSCSQFDWHCDKTIATPNPRRLDWIENWIKYGIDKNPGVILDSSDYLSEIQLDKRLDNLKLQFGFDAKNIPYISYNRYYNKNDSILFALSCTSKQLLVNFERKDPYAFNEKINEVVWRGTLTGRDRNGTSLPSEIYANDIQRIRFVKKLSNKYNVKFIDFPDDTYQTMVKNNLKNLPYYTQFFRKENENLFGNKLDWFKEIRKYKYILNLEGHDCPSSLIPSLFSSSVTLLPIPKWHNIVHFKLKPWIHYVPLKDDASDFDEKLEWCRNNNKECKNISIRSSEYISQFTPNTEKEIEKLIFKNLIKNNKWKQN